MSKTIQLRFMVGLVTIGQLHLAMDNAREAERAVQSFAVQPSLLRRVREPNLDFGGRRVGCLSQPTNDCTAPLELTDSHEPFSKLVRDHRRRLLGCSPSWSVTDDAIVTSHSGLKPRSHLRLVPNLHLDPETLQTRGVC